MASSPRWLFVCMYVCAYKTVALESDDHELFWIDFNDTLKKFQLVSSQLLQFYSWGVVTEK
jgi:hypothetical protein